ncbi:pancreatic secretory granule membrane major glycoprotein GP2-like [Rana temporaria]|uniref:pancreatic secretory granule membrane major glycoprotein GP2-like n=1 Tax=Rana temporaria TaxID=8407 RepID=UPI001AAD482E|nr:pancreatic secretory granule membrane major glycoprotein GP2-like [Rana temporaria]
MKTTLLLSVLCAVMAAAASQSCGSVTCATDEICNNSTNTCQCNSTFYTFTPGSLPSPNFNCTGAMFNIQVSKCWLEEQGYNTSDIRLNGTDPKCFAVNQNVNGISEMILQRPLVTSDCNTVPAMNATHVMYTNQLYIFGKTDPIRITNDVVMNISCSYPLNMNVALNVTLHPIIGTTEITGPSGNGSYTAVMLAFKENTYTTPLSDSDTLTVEDPIYLSVRVSDLDANAFKLKVVNIYASPTNSSNQKYYLLENGCPSSQISSDQLTVESNGVGTESRFLMKVFKITSSNTVYLYADLALCTTDCNSTCSSRSISRDSPDIAGRVSIYLDAADTSYNLDTSSASGFSMPWTLSALIFSWILMKLM